MASALVSIIFGSETATVRASLTPYTTTNVGTSIYKWQYFCPTYRKHVAVMENLKGKSEEQLAYVNQERAKLEYRRQV
jgi:hypothetical protein